MSTFRSARLRFANYRSEQHDQLIALFQDETVMRFVGDGPLSLPAAENLWHKLTKQLYPAGNRTIWAVFAADDTRYVGHAALRPRPTRPEDWEISYILKNGEWGNGFATEIAARLIDFGFAEMTLPEVFATIDEDNIASARVAKKIGMTFKRFEYDNAGRFLVYSIPRPKTMTPLRL